MYRNDTFKNPGGKQFRVEAQLEAAGQANLRVQLKNGSGGIVYDFGTITVTSTAFSNKVFTSTSVVTSTASQVVITNQGPGVVIGQTVIGRD